MAARPAVAVVGIGAPTSSLDALEMLFAHLAPRTGLAFVVLCDRSWKPFLQRLEQAGSIEIRTAEDRMPLEANCAYLAPSDTVLTLERGRLRASRCRWPGRSRRPIDEFLRSAARDQGERAAAVLLSGTGRQGLRGLRAVKEAGGLVVIESPAPSKRLSLPRRARIVDLADAVLVPEQIGGQLASYARRLEPRSRVEVAAEQAAEQATARHVVEARLRRSEEDFRTLAESIPHMVWTARADGTGEYQNHRFLEFFARPREEMSRPDAWLEHLHPDDAAKAEAWHQATSSGAECRLDARLRRGRDGAYLWHAAHAVPVRDEDGVLLRWFGTLTDIQDRKDAERQLSHFATIIESSDAAILSKDLEGTLLSWNPAAERLFGYSAEEALGRSIELIVPPERRGEGDTLLGRIRNGEVVSRYETQRVCKDGTRVDVALTISPIRDSAGRIVGASDVGRDITQRKRTEAALRASEKRFRQVLARAPVPIAVYDDAGTLLETSDLWRQVSGYSREEIPTLEAWARLAGDRSAELLGELERRWGTDEPTEVAEITIRTKSGAGKTLLLVLSPMGRLPNGQQAHILAATDITARKRAEKQLSDANQHKDQFLAMLGHELRNPLAAIRSAAELLSLSYPNDAGLQRINAILKRQSGQMAKLIDGLLDVSRIARGRIALNREKLDLAAIVREVLEDRTDLLQHQGLELRAEIESGPIWVDGDRTRLAQIVDNLISNAVKFTDPPGRVTVTVRQEQEGALLEVRDTGIGIEPDLLEHIFEPFRQTTRSLERVSGGLGLGLAVVEGLVRLHGGAVKAVSAGRDRGAALSVQLPTAVAPPEATAPVRAPAGGRRVLVVEDSRDTAELLRDLLEATGHEAAVVFSGEEAAERARRFRPEAVLCDVGLPGGMNGFDVARAFRSDAELKDTFLVAITGYGRPEDRRQAEEAGFDAHLTKPVDFERIEKMLAAVGARRTDRAR